MIRTDERVKVPGVIQVKRKVEIRKDTLPTWFTERWIASTPGCTTRSTWRRTALWKLHLKLKWNEHKGKRKPKQSTIEVNW